MKSLINQSNNIQSLLCNWKIKKIHNSHNRKSTVRTLFQDRKMNYFLDRNVTGDEKSTIIISNHERQWLSVEEMEMAEKSCWCVNKGKNSLWVAPI